MPVPQQPGPRSRTTRITLLSIGLVLLVLAITALQAFNLTFLRPDTIGQTMLFFVLSALIFFALIVLTYVLLRTIFKLYLERQTHVPGSKFRGKMVLGALVLSFGPVIALFLFSYGLMNRSIDKWFSRPLQEVQEHTAEVTALLASYAGKNAEAEAQGIAASEDARKAFHTGNFGPILDEFRRREATLQGGFAVALYAGEAEAIFNAPEPWNLLRARLPATLAPGTPSAFTMNGRDYMVSVVPAGSEGQVLVAMPLPEQYSGVLRQLDNSEKQYSQLQRERRATRRLYIQLLLLITLFVLFASAWLALALAKLVTRPVTALAEATQAISEGRFEYRVDVRADDELADLVSSFNRMAGDLQLSRAEIEGRRRSMEILLESIPSGVLSLGRRGEVLRVNAALVRMFHLDVAPGPQASLELAELFGSEVAADIERSTRKAERMGATTSQMEIRAGGGKLDVAVTVASTSDAEMPGGLSFVVVFEDLSDLLRAQKQAAWREVARRIAHEIKNPLTPITLNAQRIERLLQRGPVDAAAEKVLAGCAGAISSSVETVRTLVDEFSTLARFPQSEPRPSDVNQVIESALVLFEGRLRGIRLERDFAADLPPVMADPEAIKRVVANLVENAAEAMQESLFKSVTISTVLLGTRETVEIVVADTGHGVTADLKEKLFLPYFSTKGRGTGLGLAIASRIIEEHAGSIRVEENKPLGTRFIVELPVASQANAAPERGKAQTPQAT